MSELFVLFTMDVEPTVSAAGAGVSGPASKAEGAVSIANYFEVLRGHGFSPTYFVHPDVASTHAGQFQELANAGAGVGLHLHTSKFASTPGAMELGYYDANAQRNALREAMAMFEQALGWRPTIFRPGCFSANDATFGVLTELGFKGGSVSIPGRIWPDRYCVWSGAPLDPHLAHASFRQARGDMPFVNVPLSVDYLGGLKDHPVGFQHYPDLRPGGVYTDDEGVPRDHLQLLRSILKRVHQDAPVIRTLVVDVHNDRDFTGDSVAAGQLRTVLNNIRPEAEALGMTVVDTTMDDLISRFYADHSIREAN